MQTAVINDDKTTHVLKNFNLWLNINQSFFYNMRCFVMFITAVCISFLFKLKWPKKRPIQIINRNITYEKQNKITLEWQ